MTFGVLAAALCLAVPASPGAQEEIFGRTDTQKEIEMGREFYDRLLRSERISQNDQYIRRVNRVFTQLVTALPEKLYPYQAVVIADNEVNAGCFPGGYIIVHEGLLAVMPDDDQLAFVLAHELGHGARRHAMREIRKTQSVVAVDMVMSVLLGTPATGSGTALARISFTRDHENEADAFGTELYLRAGFDPAAVSSGMKEIARISGTSNVPEYLRTHPDPLKRIASIEDRAKKLLESGLVPNTEADVNLRLADVFGTLPTLAPQETRWSPACPGAYWKYQVAASDGGTSSYEIKALGVAEVGSASIWRMELTMAGLAHPYQLTADGDRLWRRNTPNNPKSVWLLEASLLPAGESEGAGDRAFLGMTAEDVKTPAGSFAQCAKVQQRDKKRWLTLWFAPGIGLVKRVNNQSGTVETLVEYRTP